MHNNKYSSSAKEQGVPVSNCASVPGTSPGDTHSVQCGWVAWTVFFREIELECALHRCVLSSAVSQLIRIIFSRKIVISWGRVVVKRVVRPRLFAGSERASAV